MCSYCLAGREVFLGYYARVVLRGVRIFCIVYTLDCERVYLGSPCSHDDCCLLCGFQQWHYVKCLCSSFEVCRYRQPVVVLHKNLKSPQLGQQAFRRSETCMVWITRFAVFGLPSIASVGQLFHPCRRGNGRGSYSTDRLPHFTFSPYEPHKQVNFFNYFLYIPINYR